MAEDDGHSTLDTRTEPGSVLSAEATWEGKINSTGSLRVEGIVHGDLDVGGTLTVAAHAQVDGTIHARTIVARGELQGVIRCDDRLELLAGSDVGGDIETGTLVVQAGAYVHATSLKMQKAGPIGLLPTKPPEFRMRPH